MRFLLDLWYSAFCSLYVIEAVECVIGTQIPNSGGCCCTVIPIFNFQRLHLSFTLDNVHT